MIPRCLRLLPPTQGFWVLGAAKTALLKLCHRRIKREFRETVHILVRECIGRRAVFDEQSMGNRRKCPIRKLRTYKIFHSHEDLPVLFEIQYFADAEKEPILTLL